MEHVHKQMHYKWLAHWNNAYKGDNTVCYEIKIHNTKLEM